MLIFNVSLVFAALRTNPFHFFIVAFEQLLFIRKKPKMNVATRVCRIKPQLIRSIVLALAFFLWVMLANYYWEKFVIALFHRCTSIHYGETLTSR
jgi:hypothetical protein